MVVKDPKNKKPILQLTYQSVEADPEEVERRLTRAYAVVFEFALENYKRKHGKSYGKR